MAFIADMDSLGVDTTGHVDGSTLNAPRTKTPQGDEINAVGWGAAVAFGTTGSINVQQIIGYENEDIVVLDADLALSTKTKRAGVPYSNYIVKGFYRENVLAVIEGKIGRETVEFKLPILR